MVVLETAVIVAVAKGVAVGTSAVSTLVGSWWIHRKLRRCVSSATEKKGVILVQNTDAAEQAFFEDTDLTEGAYEDLLGDAKDPDVPPHIKLIWERERLGRFSRRLCRLARAKYGPVSRTEANRLMVRRYLYDHLVEHHTRTYTIAKVLDLAVELFFIPTAVDVEIAQLRATAAVTGRIEDANANYWSFWGRATRAIVP